MRLSPDAWGPQHEPERRAERDSLARSERGFKGVRRSTPLLEEEVALSEDLSQRFDELVARAADIRGYL